MTYKAGTGHWYVDDAVLFEVKDALESAKEQYESMTPPFDDRKFFDGYLHACNDILERLSGPFMGPQ